MVEELERKTMEEILTEAQKLQQEVPKGPIGGIGAVNQSNPHSVGTILGSLSEYVLDALANPSIDHWPLYAMIAITVLLAYLLHTALDAKIEENIRLGRYGNEPEPREYTEEEFHHDLDKNGPYNRAMSALTSDALIKLRPLISKRAYSNFAKRRQVVMQERLGYFQQQETEKYIECI